MLGRHRGRKTRQAARLAAGGPPIAPPSALRSPRVVLAPGEHGRRANVLGGLSLPSRLTDVLITLTATEPTRPRLALTRAAIKAPGQNPGAVTVTGGQSIPASVIKNGNLAFNVTTQPPAQPTAAEAGCPSANWTGAIIDPRSRARRSPLSRAEWCPAADVHALGASPIDRTDMGRDTVVSLPPVSPDSRGPADAQQDWR